jgi:hypothetical protein
MNLRPSANNRARAEWGCDTLPIKVQRPKSPSHRDRMLNASKEETWLANSGRLRPVFEIALVTAMREGGIAALSLCCAIQSTCARLTSAL